jgi:hypothetical protein
MSTAGDDREDSQGSQFKFRQPLCRLIATFLLIVCRGIVLDNGNANANTNASRDSSDFDICSRGVFSSKSFRESEIIGIEKDFFSERTVIRWI